MDAMGMDRVGGPGGSALAIQISQAGWTDATHLSIYQEAADRAWSRSPVGQNHPPQAAQEQSLALDGRHAPTLQHLRLHDPPESESLPPVLGNLELLLYTWPTLVTAGPGQPVWALGLCGVGV